MTAPTSKKPTPITVASVDPSTEPLPVTVSKTDPVIKLAIIAMLGSLITGLLNLGGQYISSRNVEEVKTTLAATTSATDQKLENIQNVADATHTLTNSAMGASLELVVSAYEQLLARNPADKAVQSQLETARNNLAKHVANQGVVDAGLKKATN